jgi:hypothetical protein
VSVQNAPKTFGLTSPQFDWQNAETNLSLFCSALLMRLAILELDICLPPEAL